jgi:beta-galactosidase
MTPFIFGKNHLRVVAEKDGTTVIDETEFEYQTAKWEKPARLALTVIARESGTATLEATLHDEHGTLCLDARNVVRFSVAGSGRLIDNLGTSSGSRVVQVGNGRARISIALNGGASEAAVTSEGLLPVFVSID